MTKFGYYTKRFVRYVRNTRAVSALEYAILVGVVTATMGGVVYTFSNSIDTALQSIGNKLESVAPTATDEPSNS